MGVSESIELNPTFADIKSWQWNRVTAALKSYNEGEYDFGIDYSVVMNLTAYNIEDAKAFVSSHSKNESGIINLITCLVTMIALGDSENRNETLRAQTLFELLDFNKITQISFDEMTILLLCVGSSFSFILSRPDPPTNPNMIKFTEEIYQKLNKTPGSYITKSEFCRWVHADLFSNGLVTIDSIYNLLSNYGDREPPPSAKLAGTGSGRLNSIIPAKSGKLNISNALKK